MRQTTKSGSEQLRIRIRALERENAELQRRLQRLETTARPLQARLAGALQTS
jgi:chaperonin cofactor prefoldin